MLKKVSESRPRGGLSEISLSYGTDKGPTENGYSLVYDLLLAPLRSQPVSFMEIGLARGGPEVGGSADRPTTDVPSVRMWLDYFPQGHVYGVDISDFSAFQNDRFTFHRADCGDAERLAEIAALCPPLDVILDDGSHASFHQKTTFHALFPRLKPGGLYIVEDLNWQPAEYERTLPPTPLMAEILHRLMQNGSSPHIPRELTDEIATILIFGEDQLIRMRGAYNAAHGLTPRLPHYADGTSRGVQRVRSAARRALEGLLDAANVVRDRHRRPYRSKLAIIQKAL